MKLGRNDPCPCGSGKKYKHCCERKSQALPTLPPIELSQLNALLNSGLSTEAEARAGALLQKYPDDPRIWKLLATALQMQGKDALPILQKVIELSPNDALSFFSLAVEFNNRGHIDRAITSYRSALALKPNFVEALCNLGNILKSMGQFNETVKLYQQALRSNPNAALVHNSLGSALKELGRIDEALQHYQRAITIDPMFAEAHNNLGSTFRDIGQIEKALKHFQKTFEIQPRSFLYALQVHLLLPIIPASVDAIMAWRTRFQNGITALLNLPNLLGNPLDFLNSASFYLAYHNTSDRPVMEALRHFYRTRVPDLTFAAPHCLNWQPPQPGGGQRIKVGFLSELLTEHTIGKHYKGFISHLDRSRFEVVVIHAPKAKRDAFRANLDSLADKAITLPAKLKDQQQVVAAERLDVLFYPDIGMSSVTYFLAYARLAPVQATSWGHPDTSGLDTMDYYVAAASNETEGAQDNYTERLVRLNRLPCFYYQTPVTATLQLTKAELGLPTAGVLYGCPQALFKIHPDFDAVLADIAACDPTGHLMLPEGTYPEWTALLKARWAKTHPVLLERVVFMPRMNWDRFMAVMSHMDVLLDPLHFGSGNTFYDAMVFGTPVVTWAGQFGRGRNVAAAYQQMGVAAAPVAKQLQDYAPLALALGCDPAKREALRQTLLAAATESLFGDRQAVREFETFLEAAVAAAGTGGKLAEGWKPGKS
jgi:predicted O-linked N-acetylglucosamine transferase (SPINDLY family)